MREGPDISRIAARIGNPASAHMLMALMSGPALTATELAREAGVSLPTASGHLAKLEQAGLVAIERQGRHRYFRLADQDVALALEGLMPVAARAGHLRVRVGPRDEELRRARSCYDHLAGTLAVTMFDHFIARGLLARDAQGVGMTRKGRSFFSNAGIAITALESGRRPLCRSCLDWSERRSHLGGALGAAIFKQILARGWATREALTRIVRFGRGGEKNFQAWLAKAATPAGSAPPRLPRTRRTADAA